MEERNYELLVNFRFPHEGFSLGYDIIPPNESEDYNSFFLYLGPITLILNWD